MLNYQVGHLVKVRLREDLSDGGLQATTQIQQSLPKLGSPAR
jgi:hypothetical protein